MNFATFFHLSPPSSGLWPTRLFGRLEASRPTIVGGRPPGSFMLALAGAAAPDPLLHAEWLRAEGELETPAPDVFDS